jgi:formylglycine-generating enzyme required for sulfatase activity
MMVVVPAGEFMMGSPESEENRNVHESPQHKVTIAKPFAVSKFEVTFEEWDVCVLLGGCNVKPGDQAWGRGKRPVINMSWDDAKEYVAWLSKQTGKPYRLLSEAEWEYAVRARTTITGESFRFSFGDDESKLEQYAWYAANSGSKTQQVGTKGPNAFALYDMHGNVWEWVEDCYVDSYDGAPIDGSARTSGDCATRVVRGGSWNFNPENLRSANRGRLSIVFRSNGIGFRVGRMLTP